jgi:hypothetical protein
MLTYGQLLSIQDLLWELYAWIDYDPDNELELKVQVAHDLINAEIKYKELHDLG